MTNEELVAKIQAGAVDGMGQLWEQIEKMVKWKANRVMTALAGRGGVEFDDLYQSGYPAMVAAVDSYSPEKGKFSAWLMLHLKTAFAELTGYRTQTGKNDPLNNAVSLDLPLSDDGDSAVFGDLIPDKQAADTLAAVEERAFLEQLKATMDDVLLGIPERERDVLRLRYWDNMTLEAAGERQGISRNQVRQLESKAIRTLRRPENKKRLLPFYDFNVYSGASLGAYRASGMSVQERYLLFEENKNRTSNNTGLT